MLTGGRPNSLGRTIEVVDLVLANPERLEDLFQCYQSKDEVVRLWTSNGMRRVQAERPDLMIPYFDRLINQIGALDQPSAQWTLAVLFDVGWRDMTPDQKKRRQALVQRNLAEHDDWIVLNNSMKINTKWAKRDANPKEWLRPHVERLSKDPRKSVTSNAAKSQKALFA